MPAVKMEKKYKSKASFLSSNLAKYVVFVVFIYDYM